MRRTVDAKTLAYNEANGITPNKSKGEKLVCIWQSRFESDELLKEKHAYVEPSSPNIAADPIVRYMSKAQMERA